MNKKTLLYSLAIVAFWFMLVTSISLVMQILDLIAYGVAGMVEYLNRFLREIAFDFIQTIAQIIFSGYVAIVAFVFAKEQK